MLPHVKAYSFRQPMLFATVIKRNYCWYWIG